jgi:hypothetical protein
MSTFLKQIQCFSENNTVSAQRAVDFYDGDQKRLLQQTLSTKGQGVKHWQDRGVLPLFTNYTRKVVERSAHTYDEQPKRQVLVNGEVDEAQTELYLGVLEKAKFQFASQGIDEVSRLLKSAIAYVQWVEETQSYNIMALSRHNADVEYDNLTEQFNSLMYATCDAGNNGGQMFRHITPDTITDMEFVSGDNLVKGTTETDNPYGIVPAAPLFDMRPPTSGFWHKPAWEELVDFNEALNMMNTEIKFGSRFSFMGTLFTNAKIESGMVVSPDAVISVEQDAPETPIFLEYRAPQVQVEEFKEWVEGLSNSIGQNWGVTLDADGTGSSDSGFKLVVREIPTIELRKTRQKAAIPFEKALFRVIKEMKKVDDPSGQQFSEESELFVDFPEPTLPVNRMELWNEAKEQIAARVLSRVDYLRSQDPDLSIEEAQEKIAEIDADSGTSIPAPAVPFEE